MRKDMIQKMLKEFGGQIDKRYCQKNNTKKFISSFYVIYVMNTLFTYRKFLILMRKVSCGFFVIKVLLL